MYTAYAFPAVVKLNEMWPSLHSLNSNVHDSKKFSSHCIGRMSGELWLQSYTKRLQIFCYCRQCYKLGTSPLRSWDCALSQVVPSAPRIGVLVFILLRVVPRAPRNGLLVFILRVVPRVPRNGVLVFILRVVPRAAHIGVLVFLYTYTHYCLGFL